MRWNWIKPLMLIAAAIALAGCATSKDKLLLHGGQTMQDIWQHNADGGNQMTIRQLLDARQSLRRPLTETDLSETAQIPYTRTAANEIYRQFQRLPNPDLIMYVFPHLTGTEAVPVPGYTTVFPLYQRVQYAMPGERVEDY